VRLHFACDYVGSVQNTTKMTTVRSTILHYVRSIDNSFNDLALPLRTYPLSLSMTLNDPERHSASETYHFTSRFLQPAV